MQTPNNYIADDVATAIDIPAPYFLQRLYDFDNMLVVLPSRKTPGAYVIARRRQFSAGFSDKAMIDAIDQPDTKMCLALGIVPVCMMFKTGPSWNPDPIIQSLMARDIWAHGGADKVADMLEEQEAAAKEKIRKETRDDLWNRSGAGWQTYKARVGANNTSRYGGTLESRKERRTVETVPSSSTVASGLVTID